MSGERRNGFSIPNVLCWYIDSLDLRVTDYLFPSLQGAGKRKVVANSGLNVGYSFSALQLKRFCLMNNFP